MSGTNAGDTCVQRVLCVVEHMPCACKGCDYTARLVSYSLHCVLLLSSCVHSVHTTQQEEREQVGASSPPGIGPAHCLKELKLAETGNMHIFIHTRPRRGSRVSERGEQHLFKHKESVAHRVGIILFHSSIAEIMWLYEVCIMSSCLWINCVLGEVFASTTSHAIFEKVIPTDLQCCFCDVC